MAVLVLGLLGEQKKVLGLLGAWSNTKSGSGISTVATTITNHDDQRKTMGVVDSRGEVNAPIAPRLGDTLIFGGLKGREALITWGPIVNDGGGGLARILHAYAP